MNETMIEVQNFSKRYGAFTAVDNISFTVPRGQIFGLLGPNGAGKTSTLECLEGLRAPDEGILRVGCGTVIGANPVLLQSTGDWEIWAGMPAHKVGEREQYE